jgi:hypothetical protein
MLEYVALLGQSTYSPERAGYISEVEIPLAGYISEVETPLAEFALFAIIKEKL